jgi:hypothetical protein
MTETSPVGAPLPENVGVTVEPKVSVDSLPKGTDELGEMESDVVVLSLVTVRDPDADNFPVAMLL